MESNLKSKSNKKTMSPYEAERLIRSPSAPSPKKRGPRLSDLWLKSPKSFNNMIFAMKLHSLPNSKLNKTLTPGLSTIGNTSLFPDSVVLDILSKTPASQRNSNFLVCKRWLNLQGRLVRRVRLLSLEGCPLLTTQGLESVTLFWSDVQSLRVVSRKNIKDSEVSLALSTLLSNLEDFKWRPDSTFIKSWGERHW